MTAHLTRVLLADIPRRLNYWLRFGGPVAQQSRNRIERDAYFVPSSVFGYVRWQSNDYGTVDWWIGILRAVEPRHCASVLLGVSPGAEVLLQVSGGSKVKQVLALIDHIEAQGIAPVEVSSSYWRTVHNRLVVREMPPLYMRSEHAAFIAREALLR